MTQREYAVDLVNALSDDQVNTLISFIKGFSDGNTIKRIKNAEIKSKRQSMDRLKLMIRSVPVDDEKKIMAEYRERKYGN